MRATASLTASALQPLGRQRHADEARPERGERIDRPQVGGVLEQHRVAGLDQEIGHQRDRLLGAARDQHLLDARSRKPRPLQVRGDRDAQIAGRPSGR